MAGEIEEPLRFNFQADLLHSGSISFGRFESESLSWERRSLFSHNRYLEEVEKYSKPGSVTEKKAYFEAHFKRKALLKQSSSESQDEREFSANENDDLHDLQDSENGNESKETEIHICVNQNVETLCVDHTITDPDHLNLEETHQTETANVNLVKSEEITEVTLDDLVVTVDVASETKQTNPKPKPKPKPHANFTQVSRIISSESSNVTSKSKIREIKPSPVKEKVKKSTRPASSISHSARKSSKSEESSTSFAKAKLPPPNKSIVKEHRSEKSLQTTNRTKPAIITPSKPHANPIATGFNFKSEQRAERRKEEKKAATETTQSRKSLNFKATPMPSFYKESVRSLDQSKVTSSSKTPNRPRTASTAPSTRKVPSNSASSLNPRPSSSTSLTNRSRLPEPSRRVQDKRKNLNLQKQKEHEAVIGSRVRETKGVHTGN